MKLQDELNSTLLNDGNNKCKQSEHTASGISRRENDANGQETDIKNTHTE